MNIEQGISNGEVSNVWKMPAFNSRCFAFDILRFE
jgi:hypothetical protein